MVGAASYGLEAAATGDFSWAELGASTAGGVVGGVVAGGCIGMGVPPMACGAIASASGEAVREALSPSDDLDLAQITIAGSVGAAVGGVPAPCPLKGFKPYKLKNVVLPGLNARRMYVNGFVGGALESAGLAGINGASWAVKHVDDWL